MDILNKIQRELKAPKGQTNSFGNYKYRSCEDILEAVKPLLGDATLVIEDEMVMLGDRFYVKATASLREKSETSSSGYSRVVSASAYAREPLEKKGMDTAQITGATSSYARKYALNGLFCIDDTKDADSTNTHEKAPPKAVLNATEAKENAMQAIAEAEGDIDALAKINTKVMKSKNLTETDKKELQKLIRDKIESEDPTDDGETFGTSNFKN